MLTKENTNFSLCVFIQYPNPMDNNVIAVKTVEEKKGKFSEYGLL